MIIPFTVVVPGNFRQLEKVLLCYMCNKCFSKNVKNTSVLLWKVPYIVITADKPEKNKQPEQSKIGEEKRNYASEEMWIY